MAQAIAMKSMSMLTFDQPRLVNLQRIETVVSPVFIQSQAGIIQGNPSAILQSTDNRSWCTLAGWLEPPQNAIVQCRKSGLTVRLKKRPEVSATLLPSASNTPSAVVQYKGRDGAPQQAPLRLVLDSNQGFVTLELPFPDTDLYDTIFTAMTGRDPAVAVLVSFAHPCQVKVPAPVPVTNPPVTTKPGTTRVGGIGNTGIVFKPGTIKMMQTAEPQTFAAAATATGFISKELLIANSLDLRRAVVLPVPQPTPPGEIIQNQSFNGQLTVSLQHASDDLNVFPDRPWLQQSGWGQVPQNKKLLFRDSGKVDTFYYLPTKFKLGYYVAPEGGTLGMRAPLAVELYSTDGGERIKATLVAVPCIEDSERQMLRAHLREILKGLQPFIYLEPRAGLKGTIANDFLSNSTSGQLSLPAEIRFEAVEVAADDRIVLRFDMPAERYSIFCSMLKFGIFGRVLLTEDSGLQAQIDLRLQLDDIVTNFVNVEQVPATDPNNGSVAISAAATLKVTNVLEHPLSISSLDLTLLDLGEKSGIIFEAEELKLLPSGGTLGGAANPNASTSFPVKAQRLVNWDSTVVERGQMKVQGGSADDWLNRVNRDPTLDKHKYQVMLQVLASAADRDRVQLIRVSLFKEGETTARNRATMLVGSNPTPFSVSMTLEELMGTSGRIPSFFIEYDTVDMTNNVGLPQRVPVSAETKDFHLLAIVESPGMTFIVEHDGPTGRVREELDRPNAEQLINRLRSEGKSWDVFTKKAVSDPSGTTSSTTGTTPPPVTAPSFSLQIVTDLVAAKLQSGALKRIFVVLKPAQPGAAQTSFVFDPMNVAPATWKAELPPGTKVDFNITYLYTTGQTREAQGTMSDTILILDAPNES
jgi:hypothetical protein